MKMIHTLIQNYLACYLQKKRKRKKSQPYENSTLAVSLNYHVFWTCSKIKSCFSPPHLPWSFILHYYISYMLYIKVHLCHDIHTFYYIKYRMQYYAWCIINLACKHTVYSVMWSVTLFRWDARSCSCVCRYNRLAGVERGVCARLDDTHEPVSPDLSPRVNVPVKCCRVGSVPWTHRLSTCCTDRLME